MPYHLEGAYDGFDAPGEVHAKYRRCRTRKHFIFSDQAVTAHDFKCAVCGEPIDVKRGNRCQYEPRLHRFVVMHYYCAWDVLLTDIFKLADRM